MRQMSTRDIEQLGQIHPARLQPERWNQFIQRKRQIDAGKSKTVKVLNTLSRMSGMAATRSTIAPCNTLLSKASSQNVGPSKKIPHWLEGHALPNQDSSTQEGRP